MSLGDITKGSATRSCVPSHQFVSVPLQTLGRYHEAADLAGSLTRDGQNISAAGCKTDGEILCFFSSPEH